MNSEHEQWVGIKQIAAHCGVSITTVRRWTKNKTVPAYRIGKFWKFKLSEIDRTILLGLDKKNDND